MAFDLLLCCTELSLPPSGVVFLQLAGISFNTGTKLQKLFFSSVAASLRCWESLTYKVELCVETLKSPLKKGRGKYSMLKQRDRKKRTGLEKRQPVSEASKIWV